jgi:hypothetical protein
MSADGQLAFWPDDEDRQIAVAKDERDLCKVGRVGVYFVAYQLERRNVAATVAAEGLIYDILIDVAGHMLKLQVKTCSAVRRAGHKHSPSIQYAFGLHRRYVGGVVDAFAFVALDREEVLFVPATLVDSLSGTSFQPEEFSKGITGFSLAQLVDSVKPDRLKLCRI